MFLRLLEVIGLAELDREQVQGLTVFGRGKGLFRVQPLLPLFRAGNRVDLRGEIPRPLLQLAAVIIGVVPALRANLLPPPRLSPLCFCSPIDAAAFMPALKVAQLPFTGSGTPLPLNICILIFFLHTQQILSDNGLRQLTQFFHMVVKAIVGTLALPASLVCLVRGKVGVWLLRHQLKRLFSIRWLVLVFGRGGGLVLLARCGMQVLLLD